MYKLQNIAKLSFAMIVTVLSSQSYSSSANNEFNYGRSEHSADSFNSHPDSSRNNDSTSTDSTLRPYDTGEASASANSDSKPAAPAPTPGPTVQPRRPQN